MDVGGGGECYGKSFQNSIIRVRIFWGNIPGVFCLYRPNTLLQIVSRYDVSVMSMSGMGFQTKLWIRVGAWVSSIQLCIGFWSMFNFAKPLSNKSRVLSPNAV